MEDVLIVFIVFSFITLFCGGIYKLIRAKMDSTGIDKETFDRLAKAFIEHKKNTKQRIQNLEAIITNDDTSSTSSTGQVEAPKQTIEIEDQEEQQESPEGNNNNLRNMLHE